jgi:16S rRNA (uracil1498-N3)-methyltransferase
MMHRFFVSKEDIRNGQFLSREKDLCHQFRQVLKFRAGDEIILCADDEKEYLTVLEVVSKIECSGKVIESSIKKDVSSKKVVHLFVALLKNQNRWEWILEKGTELGVASFNPLITERTEVFELKKVDRLKRIIKESAEQSGRTQLPLLRTGVGVDSLYTDGGRFIVPTLHEKSVSIRDLGAIGGPVSILIGPEGGFTQEELGHLVSEMKAQPVSLGEQTLRTETAAIVSAAMFLVG